MKIERIPPAPPDPEYVLTLTRKEMKALDESLRGKNNPETPARRALAAAVSAALSE